MENQEQDHQNVQSSQWTGTIMGYFGMRMLVAFLTLLSAFALFIPLPWIIVMFKRYEVSNTYINGRRLKFNGTGEQLFGSYIKWWLLSLVTCGVYGTFYTPVRLMQWITKHTVFAE